MYISHIFVTWLEQVTHITPNVKKTQPVQYQVLQHLPKQIQD